MKAMLKRKRSANRRLAISNRQILDRIQDWISSLGTSPKNDYLKEVIFSKYVSEDTDPPAVRRQRAINKLLGAEANNDHTNDRLLTVSPEYNILPRVSWATFTSFVTELITTVIGETPPIEAIFGKPSGGATTSRVRTMSHPAQKFVGIADVTQEALDWLWLLREESPILRESLDDIRIVPWSVLFTVPKSTEVDRCACKEPDINMLLQKGIGSYIRRALRRVGVNLNDQTINQRLAREGSRKGHLATIDLSSASDSIAYGLVEWALPPCWFTLLNDVRSKKCIIDGEEHSFSMFSSMGNGFTFELESLLFYSIARAVCYFGGYKGKVSVYGDDLIVPVEAYADLCSVMSFCGFTTNEDKSFASGPFRESCGGHYYDGLDITPIYIRRPIVRITDLIHLLNSLRRWAQNEFGSGILDPEVWPLWSSLRKYVPVEFWGGYDLNGISALVTAHAPRLELIEDCRVTRCDEGGYVYWHTLTWDRDSESAASISTSTMPLGERFWKKRRSPEQVYRPDRKSVV